MLLNDLILLQVCVDMWLYNTKLHEDGEGSLALAELVFVAGIVQGVYVDLPDGLLGLVLLVQPQCLLEGGAALHGDALDLTEVLWDLECEVGLIVFSG